MTTADTIITAPDPAQPTAGGTPAAQAAPSAPAAANPASAQTAADAEPADSTDAPPAREPPATAPAPLTPEQQQIVKRFKLDPTTNRALQLMQPAERDSFIRSLDERARFTDQLLSQHRQTQQPAQQQTWPGVPQIPQSLQPPAGMYPPADPYAGQPNGLPMQQAPQQQQPPAAYPPAGYGQQGQPQQFDPSRFWSPVGEFLGDANTARHMQQAVEATVQANLQQIAPVLQQYQATIQQQQAQLAAQTQWIEQRQFEAGLDSWEPPEGVDKNDPQVREAIYGAAVRLLQTQYDPVHFNLEHAAHLAASSVFNGPIQRAAQTQRAAAAAGSRRGSPKPVTQSPSTQAPLTGEALEDDWLRRNPPDAT